MGDPKPRYRFYVPDSLEIGASLELPERVSHQMRRVLRLRIGDRITLFNGDGRERDASIVESGKSTAVVNITGPERAGIVPGRPEIHLGQSLVKSDRFDMVVQKATELGVSAISAMETERSVVSLPADRARSRLERWQRIAIEALEQSERADFAGIDGPHAFTDVLRGHESSLRLIAAERTRSTRLASVISSDCERVSVLTGPEGGFSDAELDAAQTAGWIAVSLGPTILRSETAGIAAVAMIRALSDAANHGAGALNESNRGTRTS